MRETEIRITSKMKNREVNDKEEENVDTLPRLANGDGCRQSRE